MKKEQKFLITDNQYDVQYFLDKGWFIVSVTAQHLTQLTQGKFAIVLEREVNNG